MPIIQARRFSYRLPAWRQALMILTAAGFCLGGGYKAYCNTRGLRILAFQLSPGQASVFWWCMCLILVPVLLLSCWQTWCNALAPGYVELGAHAVLLPRAWRPSHLPPVPYSAIQQVRTVQLPGQEMTVIRSSVGDSRLMASGFSNPRDFRAFLQALAQRLP